VQVFSEFSIEAAALGSLTSETVVTDRPRGGAPGAVGVTVLQRDRTAQFSARPSWRTLSRDHTALHRPSWDAADTRAV